MERAKILIAYGTRYGATTGTAKEIAKCLQDDGFEVKVVNLKEEKIKDLSEFEVIIIGSGMKMEMWTSKTKSFLNKFNNELKNKKVALFVSSGARALMEYKGESEEIERINKKYLEDKVTKYGLKPISMAMFGGIWDFNQMGKIYRKFLEEEKANFIPAGFKETEPGVFDSRNWGQIRNWAKEIAIKS